MRFARTAPLLAAVVALSCVSAGAAPPAVKTDAKEKALVCHVDAHEQASIALLEQIVNVNSGTMNFAGVRKVADMLRPRFEALGFNVTWVDGTPFGRAGHLIATRAGRGPHVLLI